MRNSDAAAVPVSARALLTDTADKLLGHFSNMPGSGILRWKLEQYVGKMTEQEARDVLVHYVEGARATAELLGI